MLITIMIFQILIFLCGCAINSHCAELVKLKKIEVERNLRG